MRFERVGVSVSFLIIIILLFFPSIKQLKKNNYINLSYYIVDSCFLFVQTMVRPILKVIFEFRRCFHFTFIKDYNEFHTNFDITIIILTSFIEPRTQQVWSAYYTQYRGKGVYTRVVFWLYIKKKF